MNCRKARKWISRSLDGELRDVQQRRLEAHLAQCPPCRDVREQWSGIGDIIRTSVADTTVDTEQAWQQVRRGIRDDATVERALPLFERTVIFPRIALTAACLALLALSVLFVGPPTPDGEDPEAGENGGLGVEIVETDLPNATLMVYRDSVADAVVVWVASDNGESTPNDQG